MFFSIVIIKMLVVINGRVLVLLDLCFNGCLVVVWDCWLCVFRVLEGLDRVVFVLVKLVLVGVLDCCVLLGEESVGVCLVDLLLNIGFCCVKLFVFFFLGGFMIFFVYWVVLLVVDFKVCVLDNVFFKGDGKLVFGLLLVVIGFVWEIVGDFVGFGLDGVFVVGCLLVVGLGVVVVGGVIGGVFCVVLVDFKFRFLWVVLVLIFLMVFLRCNCLVVILEGDSGGL